MMEARVSAGKENYDNSWPKGPSQLVLPVNRVEIWRVFLDEPSGVDAQSSVLSADEVERAKRFHFEKDRIRFTHCRLTLRELLARYLATPAGQIRFQYSVNGKPQLAANQNRRGLQFNVSHSANVALIAISDAHQVGVDVEKIRHEVDTAALSERFFSVRERNSLRALPEDLRVPGFFACWTRKEAFLKATGEGLSFPLKDFSVTTHPDLDPALEEIRGDSEAQKQWFLRDVQGVDGYRAALAVDRSCSQMETYAWN
jgi:4'-phosphopantetheinyl transferase